MAEPSSPTPKAPDLLQSGSEMAGRIRDYDWSLTSIGSPESWSSALRTTVDILLANRFPMLLWWGPDYVSIYNDAYRPILGGKHPWGLGRPVRECWSEIWDVLRPLIDSPFRGGPSTWVEDIELHIKRSGYTEETHFTVAYSPVPDGSVPGGIGGVLATVNEITEKIVAQRRVSILRDLGARTSEAKTASEACQLAAATLAPHAKDIPFALLYLADEAGTQVRLAASCGVPAGEEISPQLIDLNEAAKWPIAGARTSEQMQFVENLSSIFARVPAGPWADPTNRAVILPIPSRLRHIFAGYLVVGLSARLAFDDEYKSFLELATSQIATAIANAKAYEEERKRAEALAEIDRAKTLFFSNVSHEFRTPLTLMLGPLEDALNKRSELAQPLRTDLEVAHRNSLRLLRLVNSLLDFSRIEAGRVKAVYEPTVLSTFTADLASGFRSATERAGLELIIDCPALPEPVYVDHEMWEKIVLNLISNAFKFTFDGKITISLRAAGNCVELTVADTGVGIPAAELPNIFTRFHRVRNTRARTHEGSGIGLALVQELARLHGGAVGVESVADRGTTFTVSLPLGKAHLPVEQLGGSGDGSSTGIPANAFVEEALRWLPEHESQRSDGRVATELGVPDPMEYGARERSGKEAGGAAEKVLIVDDNADMRDYLRRLLSGRYNVFTATRGDEALAIAKAERPDLMLADVMMPVVDGFDLLRAVRSDPAIHNMLFILLSARAGEDSRTEGMEVGANDYLVKPFSARELLARVASHLDLTRMRRESEQALKESRDRLALAQSVARAGSFDLDPKTDILIWSDDLQALYGASAGPREMSLNGWAEWILPTDRARVLADFARGFETENVKTEFRIGRRDTGEMRWIEVRGRTLRDSDGTPVRLMGIAIDITEHKQIEAALRESEERFRALVTASSDVVYSMNPDWTEMRQLHGRDFIADTEHPTRAWLQKYIAPEDQAAVMAAINDAIGAKGIFQLEHRVIRADGSCGWTFSRAIPRTGANGEVLEWVGMASDITEKRQQEERMRQAQKLESLGVLAGGVAHDFNNLLVGILGNSTLALETISSNNPARAMLRDVVSASETAAHLTKQLLAYAGKGRFIVEPVDVSDLIEQIRTLIQTSIPKTVQLRLELQRGLPRVEADIGQLKQLVMNLIINGAEAIGEEKMGTVLVATGAQDIDENYIQTALAPAQIEPGSYVFFEVHDTGIGMTPEVIAKIFDPFFTTKFTGRGLGLAAALGIVRGHKGALKVYSTPGRGTTFKVLLPSTQAEVPQRAANKIHAVAGSTTVMVIDDESVVRRTAKSMLERQGYTVVVAENGKEGVDLFRVLSEKIGIVLLDMTMPVMSGEETFRELRAIKPDVRVILSSGYNEVEAVRRFTGKGLAGFLQKPYSAATLTQTVQRVIEEFERRSNQAH